MPALLTLLVVSPGEWTGYDPNKTNPLLAEDHPLRNWQSNPLFASRDGGVHSNAAFDTEG